MEYEMTVEDARLERLGDGRDVRTPWERGRRRDLYEQVVPPFWSFLIERQRVPKSDGSLDGKAVMEELDQLVDEFSHRHVSAAQQEQFLDAMGFRFEETPPPIEPNCRCHWCDYLRLRAQLEGFTPRDDRVHDQFLDMLIPHLELVLKAPNAYDRRHGAPRVSWCRSRTQQEQCA